MHLTLVTGPAIEPVSLAEMRGHLRVDSTAEDALIESMIRAGRERVEAATNRQLMGATYDLVLDGFPCARAIELPRPSLRSVTSITYLDTAGASVTWSSSQYRVLAPAGPRSACGSVSPTYGVSWPATYPVQGAVTIRFVAGYAAPGAGTESEQAALRAAVPAELCAAVRMAAAELYERREDAIVGAAAATVPQGVLVLCGPYRVHRAGG